MSSVYYQYVDRYIKGVLFPKNINQIVICDKKISQITEFDSPFASIFEKCIRMLKGFKKAINSYVYINKQNNSVTKHYFQVFPMHIMNQIK